MKVEPNEGQQSRHSITAHLEWYAGNWVCVINLECGITFLFSRLTLSLPLTSLTPLSHPPSLTSHFLTLSLLSLSLSHLSYPSLSPSLTSLTLLSHPPSLTSHFLTLSLLSPSPSLTSLTPLSLSLSLILCMCVCLESRAADHATAGPLQHHTATVLLLLLWRQGHYFSITSYHSIIMYINLRALCNHHGVNCTTGSWLARHSIPQWMA